jgi:hypothetical protein
MMMTTKKMQLFIDYKLILCQALKIVEEQDNICNKDRHKQFRQVLRELKV